MEYFTETSTKGATDETGHEITDARHGRIADNIGLGQDV
jgi:hypothetical protein